MKKKIGIIGTIIIMSAALLAGCGPTDEKVMELETALGLMMEAKESAEETYLDITDSSMEEVLKELDEKAQKYEDIDHKKYNDTKIDTAIEEINGITAQYQSLKSGFESVLQKETEEKKEAEKHRDVQCYLINKTGMNLVSVVLHDKTTDTYSENLLGDNVTLNSGYTLMGVVLDLTKASTEYEFVVTNDNNTDFSLPCDDLASLKINETSVTLKYDSEKKTGSASLFISDSGNATSGDTETENETSSKASSTSSEG
ncbi:hypothetical protein SAMN04487928_12450 [Butyrivibrio proteoclasticus]|uniref:Uncharacterized protein n=1 Tax=Butyrivibrio proteoclasticus TaxID=43305 RepID=A0A1I5WQK1_9FIRM|nr:hypothetical protein [Butyrivibrio proteoclasticus]SFQ22064.1 hypothetical protein SAMN04487928_12450 [Butyrivibrio proteoclasticus]